MVYPLITHHTVTTDATSTVTAITVEYRCCCCSSVLEDGGDGLHSTRGPVLVPTCRDSGGEGYDWDRVGIRYGYVRVGI